jgi:hypothetical protein
VPISTENLTCFSHHSSVSKKGKSRKVSIVVLLRIFTQWKLGDGLDLIRNGSRQGGHKGCLHLGNALAAPNPPLGSQIAPESASSPLIPSPSVMAK